VVGRVGSTACIVHVNVTLTRSIVKVKVKVTNSDFPKITENCTVLGLPSPPFPHVVQN